MRSIKRNIFRRFISVLVCAVLLAPAAVPCLASEAESATVRVGYFENEVFQEGAGPDTVKTGYAYEYYRKLSEYSGWKYEYTYGSFSDLYQMLLNGDIDLLAGLAWNEERAEVISYPSSPMGTEIYSLVKHDNAADITTDPATINGKKIGVLDSAMVNVLNDWLEQNNVKAEVVTYGEYTDLFAAFDKGGIDILAAEGDGAYRREHAQVLCRFGSSNYYLCVAKDRKDLLNELNHAQIQLATEEPNFLSSLQSKYYSVSVSSRAFSEMEKAWLDNHDTLKIGYLEDYLPYSGTDGGNADGIVKDLLPTMLFSLGINKLEVTYRGYADYDRMLEAVNSGEVDAVFPVGGGLYYAEESGIYQTKPVISVPPELVYKGKYEENSAMRIAVNEKNRMQYYYVRTQFPSAIITSYPSTRECLEAVIDGKADATTLNGLRVTPLLKNANYRSLSISQLAKEDDRCFGVKIGNEGLLRLLNRSLNVMNPDYAQNISARYSDKMYTPSFFENVWNALGVTGVIAIAEAAAIAVLAVFLIRGCKKKKGSAEA